MSELNFVGVNYINDATPTVICRESLIEWLDWGFLTIGAFQNVTLARSGTYGGLESKLTKSPVGNVFNTFRSNLVWQSGVGALVGSDVSHPGISGVYVSGAFKASNTSGYFSHKIDHINGRVLFDNPVGNDVKMEYSYKWINVAAVDDLSWFKRINDNSLILPSNPSGVASIDPRMRVQLPTVGIEFSPRVSFRPFQLGGGQYKSHDILFHCVAESKEEVDRIADIVSMQNDREIPLIDLDEVAETSDYPINYNGVPNSGAMRYPELIAEHYLGRTMRLYDMAEDAAYNLNENIFVKSLRCTSELVLNIA